MAEYTDIEVYAIDVAKQKRKALNMSQLTLSQLLERSDSFVGQVENHRKGAKYNLNHIDALSVIFKCSPREFIPEKSTLTKKKK